MGLGEERYVGALDARRAEQAELVEQAGERDADLSELHASSVELAERPER